MADTEEAAIEFPVAYDRQDWYNNQGIPLDAEHLLHIEDGINQATAAVNAAMAAAEAADDEAASLGGELLALRQILEAQTKEIETIRDSLSRVITTGGAAGLSLIRTTDMNGFGLRLIGEPVDGKDSSVLIWFGGLSIEVETNSPSGQTRATFLAS